MSPAGYNVNNYTYFATASNVATTTNTLYGPVTTSVDHFGNVYNNPSDSTLQAIQAFYMLFSMASMFMSANPGKSMFDDGSIIRNLERLTPQSQAARQALHIAVNQEDLNLQQRKMSLQGGSPLSVIPDQGGGLGGVLGGLAGGLGGVLGGLAGGLGGLSGLLSGGLGSLTGLTGIPGLNQVINIATQAATGLTGIPGLNQVINIATQAAMIASQSGSGGSSYQPPTSNTSNTGM
jgi:hypothetical protein